jgi:hypothetical protein
MTTPGRLAAWSAVAFAASLSASDAGPCAKQIDLMQARIDARLQARAATGPTARETLGATHHQPTPNSIAAAEEKLGELPSDKIAAVNQGMAQARAADGAGDQGACEQALAEVQRAIGP